MKDPSVIIEENKDLALAIQRIKGKVDIEEMNPLLIDLERNLFKSYCEKGYLETCEPEFCSFRMTNDCRYVSLLAFIKNKYGIWARGIFD